MGVFNEISVMSGFVQVLSPLLADDLGVMINPDTGEETTIPAIYLADNVIPESTLPRIVLTYQGSQNGYLTNKVAYEEDNPDYDSEDPDSPEKLYFIRRDNHLEWSMTFTAQSGSVSEVLQDNRLSANALLRKVRVLLQRESVRNALHDLIECGLDFIAIEVPARNLDGSTVMDESSLLLTNLTYCEQDIEQVDGVIERVISSGELYRVDETDPNPIEVDNDVSDPNA